MKTVLIAPRKYVQGRGVLAEIGTCLKPLGRKPLVLWDGVVKDIVGETIRSSIRQAGLELVEVDFQEKGDSGGTARVTEIARSAGADIAIGVGGGKARCRQGRGDRCRYPHGHLPDDRVERFAHQCRFCLSTTRITTSSLSIAGPSTPIW